MNLAHSPWQRWCWRRGVALCWLSQLVASVGWLRLRRHGDGVRRSSSWICERGVRQRGRKNEQVAATSSLASRPPVPPVHPAHRHSLPQHTATAPSFLRLGAGECVQRPTHPAQLRGTQTQIRVSGMWHAQGAGCCARSALRDRESAARMPRTRGPRTAAACMLSAPLAHCCTRCLIACLHMSPSPAPPSLLAAPHSANLDTSICCCCCSCAGAACSSPASAGAASSSPTSADAVAIGSRCTSTPHHVRPLSLHVV